MIIAIVYSPPALFIIIIMIIQWGTHVLLAALEPTKVLTTVWTTANLRSRK